MRAVELGERGKPESGQQAVGEHALLWTKEEKGIEHTSALRKHVRDK